MERDSTYTALLPMYIPMLSILCTSISFSYTVCNRFLSWKNVMPPALRSYVSFAAASRQCVHSITLRVCAETRALVPPRRRAIARHTACGGRGHAHHAPARSREFRATQPLPTAAPGAGARHTPQFGWRARPGRCGDALLVCFRCAAARGRTGDWQGGAGANDLHLHASITSRSISRFSRPRSCHQSCRDRSALNQTQSAVRVISVHVLIVILSSEQPHATNFVESS